MNAADKARTIQALYEAFHRGDIAAVIASVADDVDWASEAQGTHAPWWGEKYGKAGVGEFFQAFGTAMEVEDFTALVIRGTEDTQLTARALAG